MIISNSKNFVFAAFNKTGTTSIEKVLRRYNNLWLHFTLRRRYIRQFPGSSMFKHARPLDLKTLIGDDEWNRYYSFTFVRNPWSRMVSLYNFHRQSIARGRWALANQSFDEWVRGGGTGTAKSTMTLFVTDDSDNVIVNFIGRFERLGSDFKLICEQIGLPKIELPHLNQSAAVDYRRHYTAETRDLVASWCREDIEKFDYDF